MTTSVAENKYKSPKVLGLLIQILTAIVAGLNILGLYLGSSSQALESSKLENIAALLSILGNLAEIGSIFLVLGLLIMIVTWLRRVIRNLPALNVQEFKARDWHAFMFIVPVVNLLWPMFTLHEVWKASNPEILDPTSWKEHAPSGLINTWWTIMILGIGLSIPMQVHMLPDDLRTKFGLISLLFNLAFQLSFILIIGNISARQEQKHLAVSGH